MTDKPANATEALRQLWALWNDPQWCRMKADYLKGHLSYANSLNEKEAGIRAVLAEPPIEIHGSRQSPPSGETATDAQSMGQAMTQVLNGAKSLPEHLRRNYFTGLATIAISIMRGTYGRKFTAGFLRGATESLDDPTAVAFREPSKQ